MQYFTILQELFESESIIFLLIGAALGIAASIKFSPRKTIVGLAISCIVYAVCELFLNILNNYFVAFILFFTGTASIGVIIGLLIGILVKIIVKKQ